MSENTGMLIDMQAATERLAAAKSILIISHRSPDGDTIGSGLALYYGLKGMGKEAQLICADEFPKKFDYLYSDRSFEKELSEKPDLTVAVDLAAPALFGEKYAEYSEKTDLCIDHHVSNALYAKEIYLSAEASSTCEIMTDLLQAMDVPITPLIADCLYTGLITDTGCFMYSCTGAHTHRIAATLIECGADYVHINEKMFGIKSRARLAVEREIYKTMEFFDNGRISFVYISQALLQSSGADETEVDGVASLARQIEGVDVAITLREQEEGKPFRVSIRTSEFVDATEIATQFGGGGHIRAAGCSVSGTFEEAKKALIQAAKKVIDGEEA